MSTHTSAPTAQDKVRQVVIHIDKKPYKVLGPTITAEELRALPEPDVGADRDVYLEVPGPGDDQLITAGAVITLENGLHFFTAPSTITPGHAG
jgi:hypothetical protein